MKKLNKKFRKKKHTVEVMRCYSCEGCTPCPTPPGITDNLAQYSNGAGIAATAAAGGLAMLGLC